MTAAAAMQPTDWLSKRRTTREDKFAAMRERMALFGPPKRVARPDPEVEAVQEAAPVELAPRVKLKTAPVKIHWPFREEPKSKAMPQFEWTRGDALHLSLQDCVKCHGSGLLIGRREKLQPCGCVLRAIFRRCYGQFLKCTTQERHLSQISWGATSGGRRGKGGFGRKDEEFVADFLLTTRRTLDGFDYSLFRLHFLLGADWNRCVRRLGLDRGNFFHNLYRIEKKLGRVFRELQPYALFPIDEYYGGPSRYEEYRAKP